MSTVETLKDVIASNEVCILMKPNKDNKEVMFNIIMSSKASSDEKEELAIESLFCLAAGMCHSAKDNGAELIKTGLQVVKVAQDLTNA